MSVYKVKEILQETQLYTLTRSYTNSLLSYTNKNGFRRKLLEKTMHYFLGVVSYFAFVWSISKQNAAKSGTKLSS
jgi:hypothetical protein